MESFRSNGFFFKVGAKGLFAGTVIGQARVVRRLKRLVERQRVPHALLFVGAEGTGSVAAALEFARIFHCERGQSDACGACRGCHKTALFNHPDFSILFPFSSRLKEEEERGALLEVVENPYGYRLPGESVTHPVDQIRALQKQFAYGTYEGAWRTAVILHANKMRPEAANALLKTLEEPPDQSVMILTAPNLEGLLPTIVSRCQFVKFPALSKQDISKVLQERMELEEDRSDWIARASSGSFRKALEMATMDVDDLQGRAYRFLDALLWGEEARTYAALEQLAGDREDAFRVLQGAEIWLREVLFYHQGMGDFSGREDIERLASAFDLEHVTKTVAKIESLREMNFRNVNLLTGFISLWRQVRRPVGQVVV